MDGYICENGTTVPIFPEPYHSQHWFHIRNHFDHAHRHSDDADQHFDHRDECNDHITDVF